jgi:hypothetical protein
MPQSRRPHNAVCATWLERILQADTLVVQSEQEVFPASRALKEGSGSFADALIGAVGAKAGCTRTLTFDKSALLKAAGLRARLRQVGLAPATAARQSWTIAPHWGIIAKMQTVVETRHYVLRAEKLLSEDERNRLIDFVAAHPLDGDLLVGTQRPPQTRFARGGRGKSGGVRVIYAYYRSDARPFICGRFLARMNRPI